MMYRIPDGVFGLQGTRRTFERLERENAALPETATAIATDGSGFEIRFFQLPARITLDPHAAAALGLVLLLPGTEVDIT